MVRVIFLQFAKNANIQLKEVEVLNCTCSIPPQNSLLKRQESVNLERVKLLPLRK